MSIDARIPLGVQPLQPFDLTRGAMQGAQLKRMAAISAQEEAERQEKDRERAEKDAITNVLRESQGDLSAAIPRIRQINPLMAAGIEKTMTEAKKDALELANLKLVHDEKIVEIGLRDLGGVTDQQTWDFFRAKTAARNPEAPPLQEQYDPAAVEEMKVRGLSLKDQLTLTKKQYQHVNIDVGGQTQVGAFDPATGQVTPTGTAAATKAETSGSPEAQYLATLEKEKGRALTSLEREVARKRFGQADDRPRITVNTSTPRPLTQTAEADIINRLTGQWASASKSAKELDRAVSLMDAGMTAAKRGDLAQGSQAILVTFQKILDPTSVVRESEYARSAAGQSLINRIAGAAEKLAQGGAGVRLGELEKFASLAREMARAQKSTLGATRKRLEMTADRYNIPKELVLEGDSGTTVEGSPTRRPIPGIPGGEAELRNGRWVRVK